MTVVQLADVADRRCGAAGHLGWQYARGQFLLLIDGDQELLPAFLEAALAAMRGDDRLAAVSGGLTEMSDGIEYQERQARPDPSRRPGLVDHVTGCALYRTAAVQEAGHFMDCNLHCGCACGRGGGGCACSTFPASGTTATVTPRPGCCSAVGAPGS